MNYGNIKKNDIANGEGVRVSLFVSGCTNHCFHCFQPETWDFDYGQPFTAATQEEILQAFELSNQAELVKLLRAVKARYPEKNIWSYTGFLLDQDLLEGGRRHGPCTDEMLSYLDVLIDGPFVEEKKNISLKFRGSENQRVIDVKKSLREQEVILYLE